MAPMRPLPSGRASAHSFAGYLYHNLNGFDGVVFIDTHTGIAPFSIYLL